MSKILTAEEIAEKYVSHEDNIIDLSNDIKNYHKAKVESEIIPLIENEEFGRGAFNRDEYKSRILEKLQKLLEQ